MNEDGFPFLSPKGDETLLAVHVQPRAGRSEILGTFQDRLKLRIGAPPVDGEANKECVRFLAATLGVGKSEVRLVRGGQSRRKTFLIAKPIEFVREKLGKAG